MTDEELEAHAQALVADWPPLTEEQRARLRLLLTAGRESPARPVESRTSAA